MLILLFARSLPSSLLQSDPVQHLTQESSLGLHFVLQLFVFTHFLVILVSFLYTRVSQDWNDVFKYMNIFHWNILKTVGKVFSSTLTLYDAFYSNLHFTLQESYHQITYKDILYTSSSDLQVSIFVQSLFFFPFPHTWHFCPAASICKNTHFS